MQKQLQSVRASLVKSRKVAAAIKAARSALSDAMAHGKNALDMIGEVPNGAGDAE